MPGGVTGTAREGLPMSIFSINLPFVMGWVNVLWPFPAVGGLIEMLEIANATVTLDAMHCEKGIAKRIPERQGHYVLCVP